MNGKIICINKAIHTVLLDDNTIIETRTRGKLRNEKIFPVVGDNVVVDVKKKTLEAVLDRDNYLVRPQIANIDKLLIVMSTSIPAFSTYLIDKFLLIARYNKIEPIIVITKMDLITDDEKEKINDYVVYYRRLGVKVYYNTNIIGIKNEFLGSVVALCGQTGAGKSTLLNKIDPNLKLKTGEVSQALGRGKHTTRLVELLQINHGLIADTPGFSSLDLKMPKTEIKRFYEDFDVPCKYRSCLHVKEEGCEIMKLVEQKVIPNWRYQNYLKFLLEVSK